jgi:hypothetical protein
VIVKNKIKWFNLGWEDARNGPFVLPLGKYSKNDSEDGVSEYDLAKLGFMAYVMGLPRYPDDGE